nr:MAG TPA: hypothetical protein [Crassvirales sp.]
MLWKNNTIGITKSDIFKLIAIVKNVSSINSNNSFDNADKSKRIFNTLEDFSDVVDDCDIISTDLIDINNIDCTIIKLIEEL